MVLRGFGITLTRLRHEHIELVRVHRNSAQVARFMEHREPITPEAQETWFRSINNELNNYYLIGFREKFVGLIYGAEVDWEKKETGNGGIFVWDEATLATPIPLAASLMLTDLSFLLGLERTYIKVLRDNTNAVTFNRNLGYVLLPGQEEVENQRYVLTSENYFEKADRFRAPLIRQYGDVFEGTFDPGDRSSQHILRLYPTLPAESRRRLQIVPA
jgi:UDP-4-amino-4,6-dideoxy-N-acetyl-beta-L-altrosamine N-acetyltransferase